MTRLPLPRAKELIPGVLTAAGIVALALNLRIGVGEIPPVLPDLRIRESGRSLLVTIPVLCFSFAAFAAPPVISRLGEERGLRIMAAALFVGVALRPSWPSYSLFPGTIRCALAVAVMNVMMPSVLRRRFLNRLAEMTAAYTMALSIGAGMVAGFTVPLVTAFGGSIAWALAVWALPAAIALALWLPQVRWPRPVLRTAGADIGLLRDGQAWQITLYFGLQAALFYTLLSWLPTIYRAHGTSPSAAGGLLAIMTGVGIAGNLIAPLLANRLGDPRPVVLTTSALIFAGLAGVLIAPTQLALVWVTLLGLGTSGTFSLTLLLIASRARDAVLAARLSGMALGIGYLIAAVGPLLAGLLHSASDEWQLPLLMTVILCVAQMAAGLAGARPGAVIR